MPYSCCVAFKSFPCFFACPGPAIPETFRPGGIVSGVVDLNNPNAARGRVLFVVLNKIPLYGSVLYGSVAVAVVVLLPDPEFCAGEVG
jgi:hypothetical protein